MRHCKNGNAGEIEMKGEDVAQFKPVREGESRRRSVAEGGVGGEAEDRTVTARIGTRRNRHEDMFARVASMEVEANIT